MFIVYKLRDYDGNMVYNVSSIIGIYNNYELAKYDLMEKLKKLKYEYEIEFDHENYYFVHTISKNGIDSTSNGNGMICFEILEKKLCLDEIKMKS